MPPCSILATVHLCLSLSFRVTPCRHRPQSVRRNQPNKYWNMKEICVWRQMVYYWLWGILFKFYFFHLGQFCAVHVSSAAVGIDLSPFILIGLHSSLLEKRYNIYCFISHKIKSTFLYANNFTRDLQSDHYHTGISKHRSGSCVLMSANSYVSFAVSTYVQGWKLTQCYNTSLATSSDLVHLVHVVMDTTSFIIRWSHQRLALT